MTEASQAPADAGADVWEDFVDIFHAPSAVFARRRTAGFGLPLLVIAVVMTVLGFAASRILEPVLDADASRQMQEIVSENPDMDMSGAEKFGEMGGGFFAAFSGVFVAIAIAISGLLLWVGAKIAGSAMSGRSAMLVATYAFIPALVHGVVSILEGMIRGPSKLESMSQLSWSPARFLDPDTAGPWLKFVASEFDLFAIWSLVLLLIGLSVVGNLPRARAAAVVAGIWAVTALPAFIGALTS